MKLSTLFPLTIVLTLVLFAGCINPVEPSIYNTKDLFVNPNYGSNTENVLLTAYSRHPLKVVQDDTRFSVYNFSPAEFRSVEITAGNSILVNAHTFRPWTVTEFYIQTDSPIELRVPEDINPIETKLRRIITHFSWVPHNFNPDANDSSNWVHGFTPQQLKNYYIMNYNMAYFISTNEFANVLTHASYDIYTNSKIDMTPEERTQLVNNFRSTTKTLRIGIVRNVSGLGGGTAHGVANYVLNNHINPERWTLSSGPGSYIWLHEFSHCMGYSHNSNMTYGQDSEHPEIPALLEDAMIQLYLESGDALFPPE